MRLAASRRAAAALLLCTTALGGCASLLGRAPEERAAAVELPVSRSEAVRRTLQAFRDQGYQLKETLTSGTEPETEPFRHGDADAVFRATVESAGRGARVTLRGTYRKRALAGLAHGPEHEVVRGSDDPLERELWARLDNLRLAIRRGG